jgi:glycine cleavage system H protein
MEIPVELKYTKNDEWLQLDGNNGIVGITDYAQEQLSDIVFMEIIVSVGDEVHKDDQIATIESVKAAADVYSPVTGRTIEINDTLSDNPETINHDPYGEAWLVKIEITNTDELGGLLDSNQYKSKIDEKE